MELGPREALEPRVCFDLVGAEIPQPLLWLPLYHPIHEVGGLDRPPHGHLLGLDLHLPREDGITYLLA
jgi:hypothetical protein